MVDAEPRLPKKLPVVVMVKSAIFPLREMNPCCPIHTQFPTHLSVHARPIMSSLLIIHKNRPMAKEVTN